jgi:hypothetical protein
MNELANVVSDVLTGGHCKSVEINGQFYTIHPPSTLTLARMLKPLSRVNVGDTEDRFSIVQKRVEQSKYIDEAIAIAVIGNVSMNLKNRIKKWKLLRALSHCSEACQKESFESIASLLGGKDFFGTARLAMEITGMMVKQKPSGETR